MVVFINKLYASKKTETMKNSQNPILSFRNSSNVKIDETKENYDIKLGGRISSSSKFLIDSNEFDKLHLSTLITETREAIDSSENS